MKIAENKIINAFLNLLYPERCPGCDKILKNNELNRGFCKSCDSKIVLAKGHTCMTCGKNLKDSHREYCPDCERVQHRFHSAKAVYEYKGPMKDAMYRFKYDNRRSSANTFARDAVRLHGEWLKSIRPVAIVPVPMYERKKRQRGYNQAEVFAEYLSGYTGIPVLKNAVIRKRNTKPLKTLTVTERKSNLKNAFKNTKVFRKNVEILVIDDIFTTGSTVDEVSEALKQAGAGEIYCLFICTGQEV